MKAIAAGVGTAFAAAQLCGVAWGPAMAGQFDTYSAATQQRTNSGIIGMPVAFQVGDTEYIAVQSGWGVDAQRIQQGLSTTQLKLDPDAVPQGGVIWVFTLRRDA